MGTGLVLRYLCMDLVDVESEPKESPNGPAGTTTRVFPVG
jgi:hypothetical protein